MLKYDLNQLGSDNFERLCQCLLKEIIGSGTITFGAGKDGAREATFKGKAPYPSESEQWDGDWIFQVKFHDIQQLGIEKARKMALSDLKSELDKIVNKYQYSCNNYIFITNVPLSSVYETGNRDQIAKKIVPEFLKHITNIHVWGGDDVDDYLKKYEAIRNTFPEFLTASDVVAAINRIQSKGTLETEPDFDFPNFLPEPPCDQIPRDGVLRYIIQKFNAGCTKQILIGLPQTGKTNILSQFARQYNHCSISYFITENPETQVLHTFLFSLCQQMSKLLEKAPIPNQISIDNLNSLFSSLYENLGKQAKAHKILYYLIVDGIEWALKGEEGNRIIDRFPLRTFPGSPYLLCSCRSGQVENLPDCKEYKIIEPIISWDDSQAQEYFKDLGLSREKIVKINDKYSGTPGYLKLVKDRIRTNPSFDIESAPKDLTALITQHVDFIFSSSNVKLIKALEFLVVSPVSLSANILSDLTESELNNLIGQLQYTGLIKYDSGQFRLEYSNEITKESVKTKIGEGLPQITKQLFEYVEVNAPSEELLIDLLLRELADYPGIQKRLTAPAVIESIDHSTTGISSIIKRSQTAFKMAQACNDTDGLIKWTLRINAAKSFVSHAINQDEINALISIGEFKEALQRVYPLPEVTSKIRLLARTYIAMKENGEPVSKEAIESLKAMAESLKIEEIDKDIAQEIALDLFPVLPDFAVALMERVIGQVEKQSIVETTIETVSATLQKRAEESLSSILKDRGDIGYFHNLISTWLTGLAYDKLIEELKSVKNIKAKESFIRQWCRQNPKDKNIVQAIYLWQETVIGDRKAISLRSLRQITELIIKLPVDDRKELIEALKIPEFISIDSPKEEWVRVHLNLAESLFEINPQRAIEEIKEVYENIIDRTIIELDEKAFCLARLLVTTNRVIFQDKNFIDTLDRQFQETFDALLRESADQFELTRGVIQTLIDRDPNEALIVAIQLNTQFRQVNAVKLVLRDTLRKYGESDVSKVIQDSLEFLEDFNERQRDTAILDIVSEFSVKECVFAQPNLDTLLQFSQDIKDFTLKSIVLGKLSAIYQKISTDDALRIVEQAIESWQKEDDLKVRLSWGYKLVESISKVVPERAKELYEELKVLHLQPASALAAGTLGSAYREVLDLTIRALDDKTFKHAKETIREIEGLIQRIPATRVQLELYAQLAASAYRNDCSEDAGNFVRSNIIPGIKKMSTGFVCDSVISFSLPVIFEYDEEEARDLVKPMSIRMKNWAWYSVVLWSLCRSYLGDHDHVDINNLRVTWDFPKFKKIISAISEINNDDLLYQAIGAIANSIQISFHEKRIEQAKALDLLRKLDELVSKNPSDWRARNLHHEGYLILAQTVIHGVRSYIFQRFRRGTKDFNKEYIQRKWKDIISKAQSIPNIADRVFVLVLITKHYRKFFGNDFSHVKSLLKQTEEEAQKIPTLLDRIDRFSSIGEAWESLRERTFAEYILNKAFDSIKLLEGLNADQHLEMLVQTANKIDPKLAEEFVAKLDRSRYPDEIDNPANITFQIQRLIENPAELNLQGSKYVREDILDSSSQKLIQNLVSAIDNPRDLLTLEKWLSESLQYHPRVIFDVAHWVIENLHRKHTGSARQINLDIFLETADLIYRLAERISPSIREGLPLSLHKSFPILNKDIINFRAGEEDYAQKWLQNWLSEKVRGYLKICDPYFGKEELKYLKYLPEDNKIKIIIITTDRCFDVTQDADYLREELKIYWRDTISCRSLPDASFLIFPKQFEDRFHDRAIVTSHAGLNIGQSLNGLGKNRGNITILTEEESKELENTYIQSILNSGTWIMEGITPVIFSLKG